MTHLLILDDDPSFCKTLARYLERNVQFPYTVVTATTVAEAHNAVEQAEHPFDIFLIDERLGVGIDGINVLKELLRRSPRSDAIVLTGVGDIESGIRAFQAGAYRYLSKPIRPDELLLTLQILLQYRTVRNERDWLKVLTEIAEQTQRARTVREMGAVIAQGATQLGFTRARLWLLSDDGTTLRGLAEYGNSGLPPFHTISFPKHESAYAWTVLAGREPVIFEGQELGPSYMQQHFASSGFESPHGAWVGLPLWNISRCLGMLMLDNQAQDLPIHHEQHAELRLLGKQAAAALDRAYLHEQEQRKNRELEVLTEISRRVSTRAASATLEALLADVNQQVGRLMDTQSFFIALVDPATDQLDLAFETADNRRFPRRLIARGSGLTNYVISHNTPLFLPTRQAIVEFCKEYGVRPKRKGLPTHCWLGVPLQINDQAIGAIVVQTTTPEQRYGAEDERMIRAIANQVAGAIQTARLKEQADVTTQRLAVLQRAGGELMKLAEQNEAWFWHAALTAITAGYALGFNRAMLFLLADSGITLKGHMGIGYLDQRQARRAWKRGARHKFTFDSYLRHLTSNQPIKTPVDDVVRQMELGLQPEHALTTALNERRRILVAAEAASSQLPASFIASLGSTEYAVLPLLAGDKPLGIVIVDNIHNQVPIKAMPLDELETLLAQVALVYANLRQRRASDQLIDANHAILAQVADQPLQQTLVQICAAAKVITGADSVLIYPLLAADNGGEPSYDTANTGYIGLQHPFSPRAQPSSSGVTARTLRRDTLLEVQDVAEANWDDQPFDSAFLRREGIRAFIAVPIRDKANGTPSGVLYLNFRTPQTFNDQDRHRAISFSELAGAAIRSSRAGEAVRTLSQTQARELEHLRQVLECALQPGITKPTIIKELLRIMHDLLAEDDVSVALILREWQAPKQGTNERMEVRHQYYLLPDGSFHDQIEPGLYRGITGWALREQQDQLVADVHTPEWRDIFYAGHISDTRSELVVLITLEHHVLGLFNLEAPRVAAFTEEHHAMLRRLAAVAALALDNVQRQANLRNVMHAMQAVIAPSALDATLHGVLDVVHQTAPGVDELTIWYKQPESEQMVRWPLPVGSHEPSDHRKAVAVVLREQEPIWAVEVRNEPRLGEHFVEDKEIVSVAALPLRPDNEPVGAIFFKYRQRHEFTSEEQSLFPIIAAVTAVSVRDSLRLEALRREKQRLEAAIKITEAVGTTLKLEETLHRILQTLHELLPNAWPSVLIYDEAQRRLRFSKASLHFYPMADPTKIDYLYIDQSPSIACRVARRALQIGELVIENIPDVIHDPDYLGLISATRAELCVALMSVDRHRLLGVLVLESARQDAFRDEDVNLIRGIAPSVSIAIERTRQSDDLRFTTAVATRTAWAAEIAHDINKEIATIRTYAYLLKPQLMQDQQLVVDQIDASAERLKNFASTPRLAQQVTIAIDSWLQQKVEELVQSRKADIRTVFDLRCADLQIHASGLHLERVLRHLLRNALEAMQGTGQLSIHTMQRGATIEVQIGNSGPSIPDDIQQRLFIEPVSTKQHERNGVEGGLGLLLVRSAVEEMGGTIRLLPPRPDANVVFAFTLPRAPAE